MIDFVEAGRIINTHGISGDIKIEVWLDSPEFLKKYKRLFINQIEYRLTKASVQKSFIVAHLEGIDTVDAANELKNSVVFVSKSDVNLPKGSYFICDIIGSKCIDNNGNEIGILTEVIDNPAQKIYVIKGEGEHLVPAVKEFVKTVDLDNKIIRINLIEGM